MPDALAETLGAAPPDGVAALPQEVRDRLAGLVDAAYQHQQTLVAEAVDKAIRGVPLPARGAVKKALTG